MFSRCVKNTSFGCALRPLPIDPQHPCPPLTPPSPSSCQLPTPSPPPPGATPTASEIPTWDEICLVRPKKPETFP